MGTGNQLHIKRLRDCLEQVDEMSKLNAHDADFRTWKDRIKQSLSELFGKDHDYTKRFSALRFWHERASIGQGPGWGRDDQRLFDKSVHQARKVLEDALEEIDVVPPPEISLPVNGSNDPLKGSAVDYRARWKILRELGSGGQGKVYLVRDLSKINYAETKKEIVEAVNVFSAASPEASKESHFEKFRSAILQLVSVEDPNYLGALKVLNAPEAAVRADAAVKRIRREIQSMARVTHPNLVRILDSDPEGRWFVSQYYSGGTLAGHLDLFRGDVDRCLRAFRTIVEAVAAVHHAGMVHRDIKPANVFVGVDQKLVLGDFGIVYFADDVGSRLTETIENVGSRDWMPPWAMGTRVDDVRPTFDVFCLGKTLWAMLAGSLRLRLWYFKREEFNLERRLPGAKGIGLVNVLLEKCIVEDEKNCLSDATVLLGEVDGLRRRLESGGQQLGRGIDRSCATCGLGHYRMIVPERSPTAIRNFGLSPAGIQTFRVFACEKCGHVQLFSFAAGSTPPAWED